MRNVVHPIAFAFVQAVTVVHSFSLAQAPYTVEWQVCLGGSLSESALSITNTADQGHILTGYTSSSDGDINSLHFGNRDVWVVKLDGYGSIEWEKCYGGSNQDIGYCIEQTTDGGYIVGGQTQSSDGLVTCQEVDWDAWILKLDPLGEIEWQRCLGGSAIDEARIVKQHPDGGYIIGAFTWSNDGDITENFGDRDAWVVKLDPSGNIQWQRSYGGPGDDSIWALTMTSDGGYAIAGSSNSNNTPILPGLYGTQNFWLVKLDGNGELQWERFLGGQANDVIRTIDQTSDGGYLISGNSTSSNGDVDCNHGAADIWTVKLDASGVIEWHRCSGGSAGDFAGGGALTDEGGLMLAGTTFSFDGDVSGNHGNSDGWLLELDDTGQLIWQLCIGGSMNDYLRAMSTVTESGFVVAGTTNSNDGDVSGYSGGEIDIWVVKLAPLTTGIQNHEIQQTLTLFPNPTSTTLHIQWSGPAPRTVQVLDATGRLVYGPVVPGHMGEAGYTLPVGALPAGLYAVRVQSAKGSSVHRFVKE